VAFRSEMRFASAQAQNSYVRALIPVTGIGLPRLKVRKSPPCVFPFESGVCLGIWPIVNACKWFHSAYRHVHFYPRV
jgi:hypothetical protein